MAAEGESPESDIQRTTSDMAWRDRAREVPAAMGPSLPGLSLTLHHLGQTPPSEAVLPQRSLPTRKFFLKSIEQKQTVLSSTLG